MKFKSYGVVPGGGFLFFSANGWRTIRDAITTGEIARSLAEEFGQRAVR